MRALLIAITLLAAGPAVADAIFQQGSNWVRLTLHACDDPHAAAIVESTGEHADAFRAAVAHVGGHEYTACWRPAAGGAYVLYEDGDKGLIPLADLKPTPEA